MKKFKVRQEANYVQGYLRYGHREAIIEASWQEDEGWRNPEKIRSVKGGEE